MSEFRHGMWLMTMCCAGVAVGASMIQDVTKGHVARPPGVDANPVELSEGEMHLYRDARFEDEYFTLEDITEAERGGLPYHLANEGLNNRLSSIRWNLPGGILVMAYDEGSAFRGPQMVLWGDGQIDQLKEWKLNDKLSRLHWYYIGGNQSPSSAMQGGRGTPGGAEPNASENLKDGILTVFKSTRFRSDNEVIDIASVPAGAMQPFDRSMGDSVSSLRWNLPDGVVVVLYKDAKPTSEQRAIWGEGELERLSEWDFNDKASRWAWYYIGDSTED